MLRFVQDYDKLERTRNMEFTLLAFLTVETIVTFIGYYTMNSEDVPVVSTESVFLVQTFYIIWILNLVIGSVLYNVSSPIAFATYRVGFRIMHIAALVYIFYSYGQMIASMFVVGFCLLEFVYLANGVSSEQMTYPGKWITLYTDRPHDPSQQETMIEETRNFRAFDDDKIESDSDDVVALDSDDYFTAFEDDSIFPYHAPTKSRATFIV